MFGSVCFGAVVVLAAGFAAAEVPDAPTASDPVDLGLFYFVQGHNQNWHSTTHWPWVEHGFHQDLGVLASLGVRTIKIGFAMPDSGLVFKEAGGAEIDRREVRRIASHMEPVLAQCAAHGIRPVIAFFLNGYYLRGPNGFYPQNEPNWYEWSFAQWGEKEGGEAFGEICGEWVGLLVEAIEATPQGKHVLYYNVFTELAYALEDYSPVVTSGIFRKVIEKANVPEGKLGADAWPHFETSVVPMKADLEAAGRKLDWTEVHLYARPPARAEALAEKFRKTREAFPEAKVVLGEFGAPYAVWNDEQADVFAEFLDEAGRAGAGLALNWGLWDYRTRASEAGDTRNGLGFGLNEPRDVFGLVCARYSALRNGDFETPEHPWSVSRGSGELTVETGDAATGEGFLRFQAAPGARGPLSIQSEPIPVTGPRLALNAYVRATGSVSVRIHCRDERGWSHEDDRWTPQRFAGRPAPDQWTALQGLWGGHVFDVPETASEVKVEFLFAMPAEEPPSDGHTLDIDAVSMNMFAPLK